MFYTYKGVRGLYDMDLKQVFQPGSIIKLEEPTATMLDSANLFDPAPVKTLKPAPTAAAAAATKPVAKT